MTVILCTIAILAAIALCCYLIIDKINECSKIIIDKVEDTYTDPFDEIDSNWRAIQDLKSDISYLPKREEEKEEKLQIASVWIDHPLYSIAKSLHSLNKYFTHSKE